MRLLVSCLSVQDPGKEARERCSVDSMTIIGFDCSKPGNFPIWACYGSKESLGYTFHVIRRLSIFRGSLSCLRNGDIGDGGSWREPRSTPRRPRLFFFFFYQRCSAGTCVSTIHRAGRVQSSDAAPQRNRLRNMGKREIIKMEPGPYTPTS